MQSEKRNVFRSCDIGECALLQLIPLSWRALTRYFLDKLCVFGIIHPCTYAYPSCPTMHEMGDTNTLLDSFIIHHSSVVVIADHH